MRRRPTIADVAQAAGLSVATVDRVINGRLPVRRQTAERVLAAADALNYHGATLIRRQLDQTIPSYRFGFLLQPSAQLFYEDLARSLAEASAQTIGFRVEASIAFLPSQTPRDITEALDVMAPKVDALAMVAVDHPAVTAAVQEIEASGKPVFSALTDFASGVRRGYIGTNNRKVGRTAGWLVARTVRGAGKAAVIVGHHRFHGHEMREIGFRSYLREAAPELSIIETQANLEDDALAYEATLSLMARHPDLVAIYVAGGGTAGIIRALREEGVGAAQVSVVCNELNAQTRAALAENVVTAVIGTPLGQLSQGLLNLMAGALAEPATESAGQTFLPFDIYVSENI